MFLRGLPGPFAVRKGFRTNFEVFDKRNSVQCILPVIQNEYIPPKFSDILWKVLKKMEILCVCVFFAHHSCCAHCANNTYTHKYTRTHTMRLSPVSRGCVHTKLVFFGARACGTPCTFGIVSALLAIFGEFWQLCYYCWLEVWHFFRRPFWLPAGWNQFTG